MMLVHRIVHKYQSGITEGAWTGYNGTMEEAGTPNNSTTEGAGEPLQRVDKENHMLINFKPAISASQVANQPFQPVKLQTSNFIKRI